MSKRLSRKEMKQDSIVSYIYRFIDFILLNKTKVTLICIAILSAILAVVSLNYYKDSIEQSSYMALTRAQEKYKKDQKEDALKELKNIISKHPKTEAGIEAVLFLAHHYYNNNDFEKCLDLSINSLKKLSRSHPVYPNLLMLQAYCYEQKKEYEFAIKRLESFTKDFSTHYLMPDVYITLIRCYKATNQLDKATATHEILINKYPEVIE